MTTIKDITQATEATPQELFDFAFTQIFTQGAPARRMRSDGSLACAYRAGDRKCAVGVMLNQEELDHYGSATLPVMGLVNCPHMRSFFKDHGYVLSELQQAHDRAAYDGDQPQGPYDNSAFVRGYVKRMTLLAIDRDLSPAVIDHATAQAAAT